MADPASYRTLVQKFYVAYFGRPADPGGLSNMCSALALANAPTETAGFLAAYANNATVRSIVDSFGTSAESMALYGGDTAAFLTAIYRNLFGRSPDSEGLAFWGGAIDKGELVRGQAALNILAGAEKNNSALGQLDVTSINNKISVAASFTSAVNTPATVAGYAGDAAAAAARALLAAVNSGTNLGTYQAAVNVVLAGMDVPVPTALDLAAADDTGTWSFDNLTQQTSGLSISGIASNAVSVALYVNGKDTPIGQGAVSNGRFSIDVSLAPGLYAVTAKAIGSSGSFSPASSAMPLIIDGEAPTAPVAVLETDSGKVGDGLTNSPKLKVSGLEADATIEYRVNGGSWQTDLTLADGANVVEARQIDVAGNGSPASAKVSFILDRAGPAISGGTPANAATGFAPAGSLTLEFNETLAIGSGSIVISDGAGDVRTIAIGDASQVTVSGKTVQINPTSDLLPNKNYTVSFGSGTLVDAAGNALVSTAAGSTIRFSTVDTVAPALRSNLPADNAGDVAANSNIVMVFDEAVKAGSGNIILSSGINDVRIISINDATKVKIDGATVTIMPGAPLINNGHYSVQVASGALTDLSGNAFAGISALTAFDFYAQSADGSINLGNLSSDRGIRLHGTSQLSSYPGSTYRYGDNVGTAVGAAGDINADGYDDVLIGYGQTAHILYGSPLASSSAVADLNAHNSVRLSWASSDYTGATVSTLQAIADMNGDGVNEIAVGTTNSRGGLYVLYGRAGGIAAVTNLDMVSGDSGFRIGGGEGLSYTGRTLADAGDINGDGLHELIFGADGPGGNVMFGDGSNTLTGRAFLLNGKTTNVVPYFLGLLDSTHGTWFNGVKPLDQTGSSVDGVGDFNRDGYDDFLIGTKGNSDYTGKATLVFGKAQSYGSQVSVGSLSASQGMTIHGVLPKDKSGSEITGIGDFNGDGYADFALGTVGDGVGSIRNGVWMDLIKGSVSVIFGHADDGTTSLSLSQLNGKNGVTFTAHTLGDRVGYDLSAAGDVNGDGYDDLIIGAPGLGLDAAGKAPGGAYVVFGSNKGFPASIDLATLDRSNSIRLDGAVAGDGVGSSVSAAGDFNGDGFADLVVGAPDALDSGGAAYIVYGRDFTGSASFTGTAGADTWSGTAAAQNAIGGAGNDVLFGGGGADVLYGGAGNDTLQVSDLSFRRIDGGTGTDTLSLGGSGLNLDLAKMRNQIFGIEVIDLTGAGNNTLTLLARDLFNLSDTTNTLKVNGNAGDKVVLGSGWTDAGISSGYHCYMQGQAVILIGTAVAVTF